jgi:hypothetical protein
LRSAQTSRTSGTAWSMHSVRSTVSRIWPTN